METLLPFEKTKREVFVRRPAKTDPKYGKRPEERSVPELIDFGIVNIDKPRGPTSHEVSSYVQKILKTHKGGHSGTLDPNVTGVLPVALANATRVVEMLLNAGKEYVCVMHLHDSMPEDKIREVCNSFIGKIKQLPPIKSAIKREWRFRKIYYLDILEIDDQDVLFRVGCQAGTYIRKLCHDIGEKLGCGGHMAELRRTKAGPFNEDSLVTLQDLTDAMWYYHNEGKENFIRSLVKPIEYACLHIPKVWVLDSTIDNLCHGAMLGIPGIVKVESDIQVDEIVAVMSLKDELICLGMSKMKSKDMLKDKGFAIRTKKVFMPTGVYPKIHKVD